MKKPRPNILAKSIGALLAITGLAPFAPAGQVWDGGGGNGLWSTAANWDANTAPSFASPLAFGGLLQLGAVNDATASVAGLTFNAGAGAFTLSGNAITLTGGVTNNSSNLQTLSFTSITLGSSQTFDANAGDVTVTTAMDLGASTLTIDGLNRTRLEGVLSGTGGLSKINGGELALGGLNTYSGDTTVSGGALLALVDGAFSPNSDVTVRDLGFFDLNGNDNTIEALNDGGSTTGKVVNSAAGGAVTLTLGNHDATGSYGGTIEALGTGPLGITKIGTGTQTLAGQNNYSGATTVSGGTLKAGVASLADGSGAFGRNSAVIMANTAGATLDITGFNTQIGSLTGGGTTGGDVVLGAATLTLGGDNTSPDAYAGLISSSGSPATSVIKIGTGRQIFASNNTYTGDTLLQGGVLFSNVSPGGGGNSAFGTGRLVISGGTRIGSDVDNQTIPNDLSFINPVSPVTIEASTHLNFPGNVDLNGGTRTIVGNVHQAEIAFNGVISNGGLTFNTASLADPGGGLSPYVAFIFAGASTHTYTGLTTVNNGAFIVFNTGGQKITGDVLIQGNGVVDYLTGSDQISDTSSVTVNSTGSTITGGTVFQGLELFNKSDTIGKLFGTGTVGLGDGSLTVGAGNFTGVITDGERGVLLTGGNFAKNTTGTLILAGDNTYTGTTTVTGGVLNVTGSVTSTTINVTGGSFVAGKSAALPAAADVALATGGGFEYHAVATTPLTIGSLTVNSGPGTTIGGSIGSSFDGARVIVTGDVMPTAGPIKVSVFGIPGVSPALGTYTLLSAGAGSTLDTGTTYTLGTVYNATNFTVSAVGATPTTITATITAATPLDKAFWVGGLSGNPNDWAASNGSASNWASDNTGTPTPLIPGATTDVFFSASGAADPGSMTMGASMSIASLTVNAADSPETRAVTLDASAGNTLTLATDGGIAINAGAGAVTLNPDLILGASQKWVNDSANPLTVNGKVTNGTNGLTVAGSGNTTLNGVLGNGSGGLTKAGAGKLTLLKANTYAGNTQFMGGALFVENNTALGSGTLTIAADPGTPATLGTDTLNTTLANPISVQSDFTVVAPSASPHNFRLNGPIDLNGGTRVITGVTHQGQVAFGGVISNGGVTFTTANLPPPSGGENSYVAFIYNGAAPHTYTGLTTVDANAFLVLQSPGEKIRGNVLVQGNGVVDYLGFPDQIADNATITVNSPGSTIAGGASSVQFQGLELFNQRETIGALFGTGTVGLGSGTLTVGAGNFSGVILDGFAGMTDPNDLNGGVGGTLVKQTPGMLTLNGANTYTGDTSINNGTLVLNGSVQSRNVLVNFSGTLMGTGTAFRDVRNAGIFSPGNSTGTFRIRGNYLQTGAGTMVIEIAGTKAGQHDLVAVGGQAVLDGTLRIVQVKGARLKVGDKVTFLTAAGGVSGRFANVENPYAAPSVSTSTNAAGQQVTSTQLRGRELGGTIIQAEVVYGPNSVSLEATQGSFELFAQGQQLTPNQQAVAAMLDRTVASAGQTKLITYLNSQALGQLPGDFDLIAPEELQALYTIGVAHANAQTGHLQRRLADVRAGRTGFSSDGLSVSGTGPSFLNDTAPGATGPAGPEGADGATARELRPPADMRYGVFVSGAGEFASVGDSTKARGYDLTTGGFTLGADYRLNEHITVGLTTGYARTGSDGSGGSRVTVDGAKLGAYATYYTGEGFYAEAALQGGYNSYDTRRSALQGTARGSTGGGEFTGLLATGFEFTRDALRIGPTASFQYTHVGFGGFQESGSLAPLRYGSQGSTSMRTAIGLNAAYEIHHGTLVFRPEVRGAWQHEFGDAQYAIDSALAGAGGSTFTVQGAELGRNSMLLGLGVAVLWNERTATYLYYDGEFGRANYSSSNVSAGVRMSF